MTLIFMLIVEKSTEFEETSRPIDCRLQVETNINADANIAEADEHPWPTENTTSEMALNDDNDMVPVEEPECDIESEEEVESDIMLYTGITSCILSVNFQNVTQPDKG